MKTIIISTNNDWVMDARVDKVASSLLNHNFQIKGLGRIQKDSIPLKRDYPVKRVHLLFQRGAFFYAEVNIRFFLYLLFVRADIFLANDLDTLLANRLAAWIRRKPLVFDSHEYFSQVPEVVKRPRVQKVWQWLERNLIPGVNRAYTVCEPIARIYSQQTGVEFKVIRNLPHPKSINTQPPIVEFPGKRVIYYQGAVNVGRYIEQTIQAMSLLNEEYVFLIVGDGDIKQKAEELVAELQLEERVIFAGKQPFERLPQYAAVAHLGICLLENMGLNYYYSLPNRIFDYMNLGIPILATNFPEMAAIVNQCQSGIVIEDETPEHLAQTIHHFFETEGLYQKMRQNAIQHAPSFTWQSQEPELLQLFTTL